MSVHLDDELLTPEQVAKLLKVKPQTLAKWRSQGEGPAFLKLGRLVRYSESAFNAWKRDALRAGGKEAV